MKYYIGFIMIVKQIVLYFLAPMRNLKNVSFVGSRAAV